MSAEETLAAPVAVPRIQGGKAIWVLAALFAFGLGSLIYALNSERLDPDFPLFTASFLYLMGITQAGVVFCAIGRLVKAQWSKPYYRLAGWFTLAFFPLAIAGFLLIYTQARGELFYWLSAGPDAHLSRWLDIDWLLLRNLAALLLFYALSAVYVVKGLRPDLAPPGAATEAEHRQIENQLYRLSPLIIIAFVLCNTLIAWDFAMTLTPHWHSTVFPIFFWFGNLYAGSAALVAFPALLGRWRRPDSVLELTTSVTWACW